MLEKGIPKTWNFINKVIQKEIEKWELIRKQTCPQKIEKEEMPSRARGTRDVPGDTEDQR